MNFKKIIPLKQKSKYRDNEGNQHYIEWRQIFGKPFGVYDKVVA